MPGDPVEMDMSNCEEGDLITITFAGSFPQLTCLKLDKFEMWNNLEVGSQ